MSKTIAITGGIGSGKSFVCQTLERSGAPIFYTDPAAKHIIRTHLDVKEELRTLVGKHVYDADGQLVKSTLAAFLCRGREYSKQVDAIVHPRVAQAWREFVESHSASPLIFMECAILFESGFDRFVDETLLVTCPEEERIRRVMQRDNIDRDTTLRWMQLQMPENEKQKRATHILLNDGNADIAQQLHKLQLL